MKTFQKICMGVGLAALFAVIFQILPASGALAAGGPIKGQGEWRQATYLMNQKSQIIVNLAGSDHDNIVFSGSNGKYTADTNGTGVCNGSITFKSGNSLNSHPVIATISGQFQDGSGPTPTCTNIPGQDGQPSQTISITNNTSNNGQADAFTGPKTISYSGVTYSQINTGTGMTAYGQDVKLDSSGSCYGGYIIALDSKFASPSSPAVKAKLLKTVVLSTGTELKSQDSNFPSIPLAITSSARCVYDSNNTGGDDPILSVSPNGNATFVSCSKGDTACRSSGAGSVGPAASSPQNSCEGSSNTGFEWIFCGVLRMFDTFVNTATGIIESLLNFDVNTYLTNNVGVHNAWSVFKNLASAILVIILLVVVIAQAIGGGPLDAYTIRKILPRLIIAVILMQISWYMLIWAIELANDAGHGMRDLLTAPFGGYNNLNLDKLFGQLQLGTFGTGVTEVGIFTAAGIAFAFSGLTIGGVTLIALGGVISLLVGLLILLLRELLIILCVILFPLAILAWILPGTQRYWKLWYDNFSKLLLLFPLIMGVIYAGRIFAHIAGLPGNDTGTRILAMLVVFVGYFGPYWFLPKTFKWGGQAFAAASSGVMDATKSLRGNPRKYAMENAKENRNNRAHERAERLAEGTSAHPRWDRIMAGRYNFARSRSGRIRNYQNTLSEGRKAAEEAVPRALLDSNFESLDHTQKLESLTDVAIGQVDSHHGTGLTGVDPAQRRWALDQLATYGDWDIISNLRDQGLIDQRTWESFVAKNISAINQKAAHLSPLKSDLSRVTAEEMTNWHSSEFNEAEQQALYGYVRDASTGGIRRITDPEELRQHRLRHIQRARRALDNPNVRDRIGQDQISQLERISEMEVETPEVITSSGRSAPITPGGNTLLANGEARANVTRALGSEVGREDSKKSVTQQIAQRLADRSMTPQNLRDLPGVQGYMADLASEANSIDPATGLPSSPEAQKIYNSLVNAYVKAVGSRAAEEEQQLLHQGLSGADLAREQQNIRTRADADIARFPPSP